MSISQILVSKGGDLGCLSLQGETRSLKVCPNGEQKCLMVHVIAVWIGLLPFTQLPPPPQPPWPLLPIYEEGKFNLIIMFKAAV